MTDEHESDQSAASRNRVDRLQPIELPESHPTTVFFAG